MITEILVPADSPILRHKEIQTDTPLESFGQIIAYRIIGNLAFPRREGCFITMGEPKLISDEICTLGF